MYILQGEIYFVSFFSETVRKQQQIFSVQYGPGIVQHVSIRHTNGNCCCCLPAQNAIHVYQGIGLQIWLFIHIYAENALVFSQSSIKGEIFDIIM